MKVCAVGSVQDPIIAPNLHYIGYTELLKSRKAFKHIANYTVLQTDKNNLTQYASDVLFTVRHVVSIVSCSAASPHSAIFSRS